MASCMNIWTVSMVTRMKMHIQNQNSAPPLSLIVSYVAGSGFKIKIGDTHTTSQDKTKSSSLDVKPNEDFLPHINFTQTAKPNMPWQPPAKGTSVNVDLNHVGCCTNCHRDQIQKGSPCIAKAEHMELHPSAARKDTQRLTSKVWHHQFTINSTTGRQHGQAVSKHSQNTKLDSQ